MTEAKSTWYKEPWFWMIITPLLVVIVAGFNLLYLAITTMDGVVVDNYYEDGKGVIVRNEEDAFARQRNLSGELQWQADNRVLLTLNGDLQLVPEQLDLLIVFPTSKNFDVDVPLNHQGRGEYTGQLPEAAEGRRQLLLRPINTEVSWRLHFDGELPVIGSSVTLLPRQE